jgi:hypothetical protein
MTRHTPNAINPRRTRHTPPYTGHPFPRDQSPASRFRNFLHGWNLSRVPSRLRRPFDLPARVCMSKSKNNSNSKLQCSRALPYRCMRGARALMPVSSPSWLIQAWHLSKNVSAQTARWLLVKAPLDSCHMHCQSRRVQALWKAGKCRRLWAF